jgi:hypothetical protein
MMMDRGDFSSVHGLFQVLASALHFPGRDGGLVTRIRVYILVLSVLLSFGVASLLTKSSRLFEVFLDTFCGWTLM